MAAEVLIKTLRDLETKEKEYDITYKHFTTDHKSINDLKKEMEKQNDSDSIEERIKGMGKQIALTKGNEDEQSKIAMMDRLCTMELLKNTDTRHISLIKSILFPLGFAILSVLCFWEGIYIVKFCLSKSVNSIESEFLIGLIMFIVHVLVYALAFAPLYIFAMFAPVRRFFMGICALLENLFFIYMINSTMHDGVYELLNGKLPNIFVLILGVIILLIIMAPALVAGLFGLAMLSGRDAS